MNSMLPMGSIVVPFGYFLSRILNVSHEKELPWSVWVEPTKKVGYGTWILTVDDVNPALPLTLTRNIPQLP